MNPSEGERAQLPCSGGSRLCQQQSAQSRSKFCWLNPTHVYPVASTDFTDCVRYSRSEVCNVVKSAVLSGILPVRSWLVARASRDGNDPRPVRPGRVASCCDRNGDK